VRVALVCPYSWSVPGGVQSHVAGLARALRALGYEVDVLAPADRPTSDIVALGRSVPIPSNGSVQRVALSPASVARTSRAVRRGYDVVHLHEPMLPAVCLTAVAASRAPLVGTFHMYRHELLWYRVFAPVVRAAARRLDARIAVSSAACGYVARTLPGDYDVIPNGIDHASFASLDRAREGRRILFVGRPEPRKGLPVLLDAFARLDDDTELILVGPTDRYGGRVRALGRVDETRLREELASADVVCAPSLRGESFGLVLVEAMAAGAPVVASRITGYEEVVPDEAGVLVPPGDADALAEALRRLLADDDLRRRLGNAGGDASRRYDWSNVAARVSAVYERVAR
jgi:phosphatidylinositol alpha-mannosyltransferase